ncbi:MAG: GAF domain-containing protein, partial [Anaerolineae bacterium]
MIDQTETIRALEQKLAEREEQYRRTETIQAALYKIADAASAATDLQAFFARLHEIVGGLMYARNFFIALLDAEAGIITFPYHADEKEVDAKFWDPHVYAEGEGATAYVLQTGNTVHTAVDMERLVASGEMTYHGTVPEDGILVSLQAQGKTLGVVCVQSYEKGQVYSEQDVQVLQFVSQHIATALTRARALEETLLRNRELAIINSIQQGLASKLELQAIIDLVGDRLREVLHTDEIGVRLYDATTDLIYYPYEYEHGQRLSIPPMEPGATFRAMQEKRLPIFGPSRKVAEQYGSKTLPGTEASKSLASVPIIAGDKVIGVIMVEDYERDDAFGEADVRLLQTIAASMGVALENARLFDETQRLFKAEQQRAAELAIINSVQEGLAAKLDYQAIIDLVGDKIRDLFHSQNMSIRLYDGDSDLLSYPYLLEAGSRLQMEPVPLGTGLTAHIIRTRQPLVINEHLEERMAELGSYWIGNLDQEKDQSYVGIPILTGDTAIGVVALDSKQEHAFSDADVRLLQTLTNSMGVSLESARLFGETQRLLKETEQRAAELSVINSVQQGLASKLDMQAIYDLVGDRIRDIFGTEVVYIAIRNASKTEQIDFPYYLDRGNRVSPISITLGQGITSRVIEGRKPVVVGTMEQQLALGSLFDDVDQSQSYLGVPIFLGENVIGVASVQSYQKDAFTTADERLLSTMAASMGVALENARLFDEVQRRNEEITEALEQQTATSTILSVM